MRFIWIHYRIAVPLFAPVTFVRESRAISIEKKDKQKINQAFETNARANMNMNVLFFVFVFGMNRFFFISFCSAMRS